MAQAIKRLYRERKELEEQPNAEFTVYPLDENVFDWHFIINGPADTPFETGKYHGKIVLPAEYPFKPPEIYFFTVNDSNRVAKWTICRKHKDLFKHDRISS